MPRIGKENGKSPWTHLIQHVKFKTYRVESWCISGFSRKGVCLINRIAGMYGKVPVKTRHKALAFPSQTNTALTRIYLRGASGTFLESWAVDGFGSLGVLVERRWVALTPPLLSSSHFPTRWVSEDKLTCQRNKKIGSFLELLLLFVEWQLGLRKKFHGLRINRNSNHQANKYLFCVLICFTHQKIYIKVYMECDLNIIYF